MAIVAGRDEASVEKAMKLIKVTYQVLQPVLDPHEALDGEILVHPEEKLEGSLSGGSGQQKKSLRLRPG